MALKGHHGGISDLCWSPDSKYIASGSDDKTIRVWDVELGRCVRELIGHHYHITTVRFNSKGNLLISGSADEAIRVWDVLRGKCLKTLSAHSDPISAVDMIWDGTIIASASYDGLIRLFDTKSGQCLKTLIYEYRGGSSYPVSYVRFSPNGKYILLSTLDGSIRLWDHMNDKVVKTFTGPEESKKICEKFSCSSDFIVLEDKEPLVVSGSDRGDVFVWDLQTRKLLNSINLDTSPVLSVDLVENGKSLVALSMKGKLAYYDLIKD